MNTKLKIDLRGGILEVEGEEAFVKEIYQEHKTDLLRHAKDKQRDVVNPQTSSNLASEAKELGKDSNVGAYATLGDLFAAIGDPKKLSTTERALAAAAHVQMKGTTDSFGALEVNKALTDVGYGAKKIARDLENNMHTSPIRVVQLKKSGSSAQARKTYKVTAEGFKAVTKLLSGAESDENNK